MSRKLDRTISVLNAIVGDYLRRRENGLVGGIVAIAVDAAGSAPGKTSPPRGDRPSRR